MVKDLETLRLTLIELHNKLREEMKRKLILIFCVVIASVMIFAAVQTKPVVMKQNCTGCQDCIHYCPVNAISLEKGKAVIYFIPYHLIYHNIWQSVNLTQEKLAGLINIIIDFLKV